MRHKIGMTVYTVALIICAFGFTVGATAQAVKTTEALPTGETLVSKTTLKGELLNIAHDSIVVRMIPEGDYRVFLATPDRIVIVDGVEMPLGEVELGTILTGELTTTQTPLLERTTTELTGTVFWVSSKSIVLTLADGHNKQYEIKPEFTFLVDGKEVAAMDLKKGMVVHAVEIVEEPRVEIVTDSVVTGVSPR